ncbi:MAG: hypothetical protein NTY19_26080 [Planctomycetota bacterium]|nr:hypothetical protein [Planctomycetota bacterium]
MTGLEKRLAKIEAVLAVRNQPPPRRPVVCTVSTKTEMCQTGDAEHLVLGGKAWIDWAEIVDQLQPLQTAGWMTTGKAYLSAIRPGQPPKMHAPVHGRSRGKSQNA